MKSINRGAHTNAVLRVHFKLMLIIVSLMKMKKKKWSPSMEGFDWVDFNWELTICKISKICFQIANEPNKLVSIKIKLCDASLFETRIGWIFNTQTQTNKKIEFNFNAKLFITFSSFISSSFSFCLFFFSFLKFIFRIDVMEVMIFSEYSMTFEKVKRFLFLHH